VTILLFTARTGLRQQNETGQMILAGYRLLLVIYLYI